MGNCRGQSRSIAAVRGESGPNLRGLGRVGWPLVPDRLGHVDVEDGCLVRNLPRSSRAPVSWADDDAKDERKVVGGNGCKEEVEWWGRAAGWCCIGRKFFWAAQHGKLSSPRPKRSCERNVAMRLGPTRPELEVWVFKFRLPERRPQRTMLRSAVR